MRTPLVVYVDVDDTLIRTVGTKRIPMTDVIDQVRRLSADGATLYCWSAGGAEYARTVADELRISTCFVGFLCKPQVLLDDQSPSDWRRMLHVHPAACQQASVDHYRINIEGDSG